MDVGVLELHLNEKQWFYSSIIYLSWEKSQ